MPKVKKETHNICNNCAYFTSALSKVFYKSNVAILGQCIRLTKNINTPYLLSNYSKACLDFNDKSHD